jgi:hypothetical protein
MIEKESGEEFGLSFHDVSACNETWRMICNAIGRNPHENMDLIEDDIDIPDILNKEDFLDKLLDEVFSYFFFVYYFKIYNNNSLKIKLILEAEALLSMINF